ncbi:Gfo/Idh/MocA family oxidoreductase [Zooshikella marina]|uniref:Gfo/Idh/MocA family protein n=1 Tax=Zooshikella ganghwensis TaxID=202772 RepID=UPI001BAF121C|nr:Gfo/Idh/MocA family oxidoreductase [Zooshikella ganghwensis]MBU2707381.1 Gfo/Idh/MocA family oxidoreductase [Zooshikella ganghwensis]
MMKRKVRWGIAGLGKIAHRFAQDLTSHADHAELYAVSARCSERAKVFADRFSCEKCYGSYQELADDPVVDVVYIASIHPFHRSMAELFLSHGKHVVVEKPAFTNVADWDAMYTLASKKGLLLIEAMKSVTFPAYQAMRKFISDNNIQINSITAAFGNWHKFDIEQPIFNPDLCGGATLDVGVYGLWLYVDLCQLVNGKILPPRVNFYVDNPESRVDELAEFKFPGDVLGNISASITRNLERKAIINGPDLDIVIHDKWWNPKIIDITYKGVKKQLTIDSKGGGFEYEIDHISSLIINNKAESDIINSASTRKVIEIMETCLIIGGFSHLLRLK